MREEYSEAVLAVVELIPPGAVLAYGDVSELLGIGGPRQVGFVMSHSGDGVAWWRVVKASGGVLEGHEMAALEHYGEEGTPLRGTPGHGSWRVDMARASWAPGAADLDAVDLIAEQLWQHMHPMDSSEGSARGSRMSDPGAVMGA